MRRLFPLIASIALALVVLSGCGSGPSRLGAAAVVGDHVIPIELVQERLRTSAPDLAAAVAEQTGAPAGAPVPPRVLANQARRLLGISVLHELVAEQSRRDGIVVDPAAVDALLARSGGVEAASRGSGFAPEAVRELVGDQIAVGQLGRRTYDRISVTADYATFADRAQADAFVARVLAQPQAASAPFASLPPGAGRTAQVLRPGRATGPGGPESPTSIVYGVPEGSIAMSPAGGSASGPDGPRPWTVVHVIDRTLTAPPPTGPVVPAAAVDDDTMITFGLRLLQPTALELGVSVSPRYGAWDPTQLDVVASPAEAGSIRPVGEPVSP